MTEYLEHPLIRKHTVQTRLYQQILFGTAIKDNALIVLPTGLGKTIVFMMVIAHYLKNLPQQKVIITAPTRPLVTQHFESAINVLKIDYEDVQIVSGETSPSDRDQIWSDGKIFVATPQTLRNDIIAKRVDLTQISLICFDEAHRAIGEDPYVLCAQEYAKANPSGRRLGFTASPGNKEKIYKILDNLKLSQFEYMDEDHPHVKPYVHDVDQNWIWVELPPEFKHIKSILESLIKNHLEYLKDLSIIRSIVISNNSKSQLLTIPAKLNRNRENFSDDEFYKAMASYGQLMLLYQAAEMLETQGVHTLLKYIEDKIEEFKRTNKNSLRRFVQSKEIQEVYSTSKHLVEQKQYHPKLASLKSLINKQFTENSDSRILVFANYKATTGFIVEELNSIETIRIHRFVGQSSSSYGKGLSQKQQKQVMKDFKSGKFNVLVSTSVGEEGLDVAQCDLVIFYDVTPSATRYIQRSGRTGRARAGEVAILITKGTRDEGYFYAARRQQRKIKSSIKEIKQELAEEKEKKRQTGLDSFFVDEDASADTTTKGSETSETSETPDLTESSDPSGKNIEAQEIVFNSTSKPIIYIDHRERGSGLVRKLLNEDITLHQAQLPIGDFLLSNRVAVERKTTHDFATTLTRGDLFDQLIELKKTFIKPMLLIEGSDMYASNISPKAIQGTLSSIMVDFDIPIIYTSNEMESIEMLITIARREQEDRDRRPSIRSSKTSDTKYQEQLYLLSSLPNINNILAERILEEFKTPKAFFEASIDEMKKVHGIGNQIATRIDQILSDDGNDFDKNSDN